MPRPSKNKVSLRKRIALVQNAIRLKRKQSKQIPIVKQEEILRPDLSEESDIPLITVIKFEPEFVEENESHLGNDENGLDSVIKSETEMSIHSESQQKKLYFTLEDITAAMNNAIGHSQGCRNAHLNVEKTMQEDLNTEFQVYCFSCKATPFVITAGSPKEFTPFHSQSDVFLPEETEDRLQEDKVENEKVVQSKIDANCDGILISRKISRRKQSFAQFSYTKKIPNIKVKLIPKKCNYKSRKALKVTTKTVSEMNPSVVISRCDDLLPKNCRPLYKDEITVPVRKNLRRPLTSRSTKCDISFENRASLKTHQNDLQEHANEQAWLAKKVQEDRKDQLFECSCGKFLRTIEILRKHEKSHKSDPIICEKCGESFQFKFKLYHHSAVKHSEALPNPPICKVCEKTFIWQSTLQRHIQYHHSTNPRPFMCDKCGNSYTSMNDLHKHQRIHKDESLDKELFRCKECGILLKHSISLRKHMLIMHSEDQKLISCLQCGKTTKNMTNMRIHMKVHDPNRILKRKSPTT